MNILHTIDVFHTGGIAEFILNFHLHDRDNHHAAWCADGTLSDEARRKGLIIWNAAPPQELQDSHFYNVVVSHTVGGWSHKDVFNWAKERHAKTVEVIHSVAKSPTPPDLVDYFVGVNNMATAINPQMKSRATIYPIVDVDKFFQTDNPPYIGRLSRLVEEKRPFDFIRIAEKFPNEKFSLAGDGALYSRMLSSAPLNVFMPGMVRDFIAYYSMLKLFVFPSKDETFSMAVAMAQAAGVPCIVQDIPQLRESTGGHAVYCNTLVEFTEQVGRFLADPAPFVEMGKAGRAWVRAECAPDVVLSYWDKVLDLVLHG